MKCNWGFIGYGAIANTVMKQLKDTDNNLYGVYGHNFEKASNFASKYGAKAYENIQDFLNDENIDAVYIATTNDSHAYYCRKCIEYNKPVLCEKPFAINKREADDVITLANKKGVYVAEAMWTWHNEVSLKVKEWINAGVIGDIKEIKAKYSFPLLKKNDYSSRLVNPNAGGGALLDIGIYPIRYIYELFGLPMSVSSDAVLFNGVDVEEKIELDYSSFKANMFVSFKKLRGEKIIIKGSRGSITVPYFHMATKAVLKCERNEVFKTIGNSLSAYKNEFNNTAEEILNGQKESTFSSLRATSDTLAILDDIRAQIGVVYPMERSEKSVERNLNTKVKTISHLGFNCKDLKKCMDFYCNIMGCEYVFALTYGDMLNDILKAARKNGQKEPFYVKKLEKQKDRIWNVYLRWNENCFIELFDQMGAFKKHIPDNFSLNYNHYCLQVENIHDFRIAMIERGGKEYIETNIKLGMDKSLQMWIHDPEGNRFELMEYTDESYQLK